MQPVDIRRQLGRQNQRLAEAADAVWRRVAAEIGEPGAPRGPVAGQAPRLAPAAPNPQRLLVEVFRQVQKLGPNLAVYRMRGLVGRMAQRNDQDVEPALFEREDLLCDEGLGQARVALQDKGDATGLCVRPGTHALRRT